MSKRRNRDSLVPKHTAVPNFVSEELTGRYEGAELDAKRGAREPSDRISRLERKHDGLALHVERMDGKLDTLVSLAGKADVERERRAAADAVALDRRRKHVIAIIGALGVAVAGVIAAGAV